MLLKAKNCTRSALTYDNQAKRHCQSRSGKARPHRKKKNNIKQTLEKQCRPCNHRSAICSHKCSHLYVIKKCGYPYNSKIRSAGMRNRKPTLITRTVCLCVHISVLINKTLKIRRPTADCKHHALIVFCLSWHISLQSQRQSQNQSHRLRPIPTIQNGKLSDIRSELFWQKRL